MTAADILEEQIWLTNRRGQRLAADIARPTAETEDSAALVLHGLGGHRSEPHIVAVAQTIAQHGMTTMRIDLANNAGESDGAFRDLTLSGEVDDAEDALDFMLGLGGRSGGRVGVAGHSAGGLVAMLLAARRREVQSLALMSAVFDAPSRFQTNFANRETEWRRRGAIEIGGGRMLGIGFFDDLAKWDVRQAAAQVTAPAIIVHGDADNEVLPDEAHEYERYLASTRSIVHMIAGADHTYTKNAWRIEAADVVAAWFSETIGGHSPDTMTA
jgi:uncharacterized protein